MIDQEVCIVCRANAVGMASNIHDGVILLVVRNRGRRPWNVVTNKDRYVPNKQ